MAGGLGLGMDRWAGQKAAGLQAAPPSVTVTPPPQLALCCSGFTVEDVAWDLSVLGLFPFRVDVFCNHWTSWCGQGGWLTPAA